MRLLLTDRADHAVDLIRSVFTLFSDSLMEKHCDFLKKHCRLCGKNLKGVAEITARNYSKRFSVKRFDTLTWQTDTSIYIPKSWVQHAEQSYIS